EVNDTPFADGVCHSDIIISTGPQENFRQCRDAAGLVQPLNVALFVVPGNQVGLTLRGDQTGEQAGVALSEARNEADPLRGGQACVKEIIIGSRFRDLFRPGVFVSNAGRAYVLFGSNDYSTTSGGSATLAVFGIAGTGMIFEGRAANDNYGISVYGAGNAFDP